MSNHLDVSKRQQVVALLTLGWSFRRIARDDNRIFRDDSRKPRRRRDLPRNRPAKTHFTPYRSDVVEELDAGALLPAIFFIFSRKGCEDAVVQTLRIGPP